MMSTKKGRGRFVFRFLNFVLCLFTFLFFCWVFCFCQGSFSFFCAFVALGSLRCGHPPPYFLTVRGSKKVIFALRKYPEGSIDAVSRAMRKGGVGA